MKIIEVCSEIGAGTRGASLGPDALRVAALNAGSSFYSDYSCERVKDRNDLLFQSTSTPYALRIEGIVEVYEHVAEAVSNTLSSGTFPLVLAADHASAGGTIAGVKSARPGQRMGVIWIDAHADLHSPFTSPSGNVHGMPLATALNIDNQEKGRNEVTGTTLNYWEKLKNTSGIAPKIQPEDLAFVAVRDTESEEEFLMAKHAFPSVDVDRVRAEGGAAIASELLDKLSGCDHIYVSFDVDSLDTSISRGTGTPVDHGLTENEATDIIETLLDSGKVSCLEVVEVNPCLDDKVNTMAETAFRIIQRVAAKVTAN